MSPGPAVIPAQQPGLDPVVVDHIPALADQARGRAAPAGAVEGPYLHDPAKRLLRDEGGNKRPATRRPRRGISGAAGRNGARSSDASGATAAPAETALAIKRCLRCGREVPPQSRAGQTCPICGAYWGFEQQHDGSRSWAVNGWQIAKTAAALLVLGATIIIGLRRIFQ